MSNNALFTIEQVNNKLIITVEAVKTEQPEARPMNADEIEDWVRRSLCTGFNPNKLTEHINALVQYELNKAQR